MSVLVHYLLKREPEILRDDVFADNILQIEFEFVVFHFLIQCIVFENPLKKKHKSIFHSIDNNTCKFLSNCPINECCSSIDSTVC